MNLYLWFLCALPLLYFNTASSSCPLSLNKACSCIDRGPGFVITCQRLQTDLNTLLSSLDKLRIERLTVIDASWPLLKKLTHTTIKSLRIVRCKLQEVEESAFETVANTLEELILANNSLTSFPHLGELFELRVLDLNNNKLKTVPKFAFNGIHKLRQLRMEGNMIEDLNSEVFKSLNKSLEVLDLSNNRFANVPSATISYTKSLKYFDLSCNKIAIIKSDDFRNLGKLIEIRLNGNSIDDFHGSVFEGSTQLQYLYLQKNALSRVTSLKFVKKLEKLEILDLSDNMLTKVPLLQGHKNIRQIKLDGNKISVVKRNTFSGNTKLQLLSLQSNQITSLEGGIFEKLDQLTVLLLENNLIRRLEKGVFKGVRRLQQLNLRNNSLNELENNSFEYVPELKMIDMAYNGLHYIPKNLFSPLRNIVWLDLSFNVLSSFEEGTFRSRIPHIILVGNPLECDAKMEWFVGYVIRNQVRTHLPLHSEVVCASPEKYAGIRLQDLITKKAEETLSVVSKSFNPQPQKNDDFLSGLIPSGIMNMVSGLTPPPPNPVADVPIIGGIAEAVPAIRNIPGLSFIPKPYGVRAEEAKSLNSAIEQFSTPLLRITSGDSLLIAEDLDQMVKAVPKLALAPRIDFTQLPSDVVTKAYRGEGISGISKEVAELSLKNHVLSVYKSAAAISKGKSLLDQPNHLLVLNSVPEEIVAEVVNGAKLPYLTKEQTKVVKEYFDVKPPIKSESLDANTVLDNFNLTPEVFKLAKLLPQNYDLNKIPKSLIENIAKGELPDPASIPDDLMQHLKSKYTQFLEYFAKNQNVKVEELIKKLPVFARPETATFTPYTLDIKELKGDASSVAKLNLLHRLVIAVLCCASIISIIIIAISSFRMRRKSSEVIERTSVSNCFSTSTHGSTIAHDSPPSKIEAPSLLNQ